jgi:hypothetical protein
MASGRTFRPTDADQLDIRAEFARRTAVDAAKAAHETIVLGLLAVFDRDEYSEDLDPLWILNEDPDHPGSPAKRLDIDARDAASDSLRGGLERDATVKNLIFCGEEVPDRTIVLNQDDYLLRLDALDGTHNSLAFWTGYSSVICIDQVRVSRAGSRARHVAGAIATPQGIVSWTNNSRFDRDAHGYPHVVGDVFFEYSPFMPERQVHTRTWSRSADVIAAVAHTEERYQDVREVAARHSSLEKIQRFYTAAGTPLAPALIGGEVGAIIEPHHVTLHDSALLMPHQLLGGVTTDLNGQPLNYLGLYEANGLRLDPNDKPIPGYIAWGGLAEPPTKGKQQPDLGR